MIRLTSQELFKAHPQPMWACDRNTLHFIEVNDAAVRRYGYSRDEFLNMTLLDIRPQEDVDSLLAEISGLEGGYQEPGIWRHRLKSGQIIYVEIMAYGVEIEGRPAWLAMVQDVTQRLQSIEDQRRHAQERAAILDALPASIALLDSVGEIQAVNQEWRRFAEENELPSARHALGENYLDVCRSGSDDSGVAGPEVADGIASVLDGSSEGFEHEYPCHSPDQERWFRMMVRPVEQDGLTGAVVMHINITEQRAIEERLRQAQRLEAVGQLTGGVAHDFNNLLTVILGNAEMLEMYLEADEGLLRLATLTKAAAEKGAQLTSRLLAFSRRQTLRPVMTDVDTLVNGMLGLMQRTLGEHIDIQIVNKNGAVPAHVDSAQLENAILNLCINARDAMPEGGKLLIELTTVHEDGNTEGCHSHWDVDLEPGTYAMIAVSDTGTGMPPDVVKRAFEPFFTTKEVGKGSGLGLSMVFGFAKQSGGQVTIYSEPGHGTTIKLYLPAGKVADTEELAATGAEHRLPKGSERILLVEDSDIVRDHVERQLSQLGYRVVSVQHGPEALEKLKDADEFQLLFTDVVMPGGMTGFQLAEAARRLRPELPVLFTSGYSRSAVGMPAEALPDAPLLQKPYRLQDLAVAVREVLDRSIAQTFGRK